MSTQVPFVRPRTLVGVVVSGLLALAAMTVYAAAKNVMTRPEATWLIVFAFVAGGTYLVLECRNSLAAKHSGGHSI